jgi:hemoglobin
MMSIYNVIKNGLLLLALTFTSISVQAQENSMYHQLGGKDAIKIVVDDFVGIVARDNRINYQFASADIVHLKAMLVDQVCMATGGPCEYKGGDMKSVHADMNISNAEFNALAECLYSALEMHNVPYSMQNKLVAMLAPMQRDIVTK